MDAWFIVPIDLQWKCENLLGAKLTKFNVSALFAPRNAIAMEKFTPARCKTAKIHQNEHTPEKVWS